MAAVVVVAPLALVLAAPVAPVENSLRNLFGILMNYRKRLRRVIATPPNNSPKQSAGAA